MEYWNHTEQDLGTPFLPATLSGNFQDTVLAGHRLQRSLVDHALLLHYLRLLACTETMGSFHTRDLPAGPTWPDPQLYYKPCYRPVHFDLATTNYIPPSDESSKKDRRGIHFGARIFVSLHCSLSIQAHSNSHLHRDRTDNHRVPVLSLGRFVITIKNSQAFNDDANCKSYSIPTPNLPRNRLRLEKGALDCKSSGPSAKYQSPSSAAPSRGYSPSSSEHSSTDRRRYSLTGSIPVLPRSMCTQRTSPCPPRTVRLSLRRQVIRKVPLQRLRSAT